VSSGKPEKTHGVSTRTAVLAGVGVVGILLSAAFAGTTLISSLQMNAALRKCGRAFVGPTHSPFLWYSPGAADTIKRLGGRDAARRRLAGYLRLPDRLATRKSDAVFVLGYCGPGVVDEILRMKNSSYPAVRSEVAFVLGRLGSRSPEVLSALEQLGRDKDENVHLMAKASIDHLQDPMTNFLEETGVTWGASEPAP